MNEVAVKRFRGMCCGVVGLSVLRLVVAIGLFAISVSWAGSELGLSADLREAVSDAVGKASVGGAISLAAGIVCLSYAKKPEKRQLIFGWALAGALATAVTGAAATMVLFAVMAAMSAGAGSRT